MKIENHHAEHLLRDEYVLYYRREHDYWAYGWVLGKIYNSLQEAMDGRTAMREKWRPIPGAYGTCYYRVLILKRVKNIEYLDEESDMVKESHKY